MAPKGWSWSQQKTIRSSTVRRRAYMYAQTEERKGQYLMDGFSIVKRAKSDLESGYDLFQRTIRDAFEQEGLGDLEAEIAAEIECKQTLLRCALENPEPDVHFLVAKIDDTVIGTVSYGPCGKDIRRCTKNQLKEIGELGSLYVLPEYQGRGVGSALIEAMIRYLHELGIEYFCLDSGYKHAQGKWLRKFGAPFIVAKDYWGQGGDHIVWLCKVAEYIKTPAPGLS